MIKHIQFVRGTTAQNDKYTGPDGEITIDTDTHTIRIHDGSKAGGHPLNGSDPALTAKVTNLEKTSLSKTEAASTYLGKTAKAESAKTADAVAWGSVTGKPSSFTPAGHNQASNTITAMTGYTKPGSTSAIAASDSLNAALGKLEKALDGKQAAGNYVTTANAFTQTKADTLYLGKTAKAASATVADSATKATQDASGNVITSTYATKAELNSSKPVGYAKEQEIINAVNAASASSNTIVQDVGTLKSTSVTKTGNRGDLAGKENVLVTSGNQTITADSRDTMIIKTSGATTLSFTAAAESINAIKVIALHANATTTLTCNGAVWANKGNPPAWGTADKNLVLVANFIGGRVVLTIGDNDE